MNFNDAKPITLINNSEANAVPIVVLQEGRVFVAGKEPVTALEKAAALTYIAGVLASAGAGK